MTWTKTFYQKNKKIAAAILLPILFLGIILYVSVIFFNLYKTPVEIKLEPVKTINITEHFSGQLYFNDILGTNLFSDLIIKNIDNAKNSIEIAMYSMDNAGIRDALYRAANRGVAINLIFSSKRQEGIAKFFQINNSNIKVNFITLDNGGYMHHKFMLVDQGRDTQKLFFSSYNFTEIQGKYDPSFILETTRPEIINVFNDEFNRLGNKTANISSTNSFAAKIIYPEGFLEIWFSPGPKSNNLKDRMLGLIKNANSNIKIMVWYLTDKDVAASLLAKAKEIPVKIITDDFNWKTVGSVFPIMQAQKNRDNLNNLEMINDSKRNLELDALIPNNTLNSFLHHHLLIIDDKTVIFGTNNWSSSGFSRNDESIMISDLNILVNGFTQSYLNNYAKDK